MEQTRRAEPINCRQILDSAQSMDYEIFVGLLCTDLVWDIILHHIHIVGREHILSTNFGFDKPKIIKKIQSAIRRHIDVSGIFAFQKKYLKNMCLKNIKSNSP